MVCYLLLSPYILSHTFLYLDYSVFASPGFDPNEYANVILAGEQYPSQSDAKVISKPALNLTKSTTQDSIAKEDISVAISKLTFGIDDVSKQIKNLVGLFASRVCSAADPLQVTAHHEDLLQQAANAHNMGGSLTSIRQGLTDLDGSAEKYAFLCDPT